MPHDVVAALIVQSGRVLLGLRSAGREFYPDVWDLFGGHIEVGEEPEETLVRELQEELSITPIRSKFLETLQFSVPSPEEGPPDSWTVHLYLVTKWKGTPFNRQAEEHSVIYWFSRNEVGQLRLAGDVYLRLFEKYLV